MIEKSQEIIEMKIKDGMAFTVSFSNDPPDYQRLDEIEGYCEKYPTNSIGFKQSILDIINKTKENK